MPGPWTLHGGHIYKTKLPERCECRYPASLVRSGGSRGTVAERQFDCRHPSKRSRGPLSLTSWAKTDKSTSLRQGSLSIRR